MSCFSRPVVLFFLSGFCLLLVFFIFPSSLREVLSRANCPGVLLPDMPLGANPANIAAFINCTGPDGIKAYKRLSLLWDSLFPISYSLLFAGLAGWLLRNTRHIFVYRVALLLAFGTGFLDLLENYFIRQALTHPDFMNNPTPLVFNILKWCSAAFGLLVLFGILILHHIKR